MTKTVVWIQANSYVVNKTIKVHTHTYRNILHIILIVDALYIRILGLSLGIQLCQL